MSATATLTAEDVRAMMFGGDLDTCDIAEVLGIRESAVWNALARGSVDIAASGDWNGLQLLNDLRAAS